MRIARRLYFYFVAGVSLAALTIGLVNLLELLLSTLGDALGDTSVLAADPDAVRRQLSVYAAITIVALPLWLLHWVQAERGLRGVDAEAERSSAIRALYLTLVLAGTFVAVTIAAVRLIQIATLRTIGSDSSYVPGNGEQWIALAAISGLFWSYHGWVRLRDMRGGPLANAADWLPRLYVYAASATGLVLATFATSDLLALVVEVTTADVEVLVGDGIWDGLLASGVARALAGGVIWIAHWHYSLRLAASHDWRGEHARSSSLRRFYGYAVAFGAVLVTLLLITRVADAVLGELFGASENDTEPLAQRLLDPVVRVIPFAAVWFYHRRLMLDEAARFTEGARQAIVRRVYVYAISLIGLTLTAYGLSGLIAVAIDRVGAESSAVIATNGDPWRAEAASLAALTIVGAAAWLWHWGQAQGWLRADAAVERTSTVRRAYLFISIAGAVVALLVSLAIVIYRVFAELLGVEATERLATELGQPLAVLVVAIALLAYHGLLLRADLADAPDDIRDERTMIHLVISGPSGIDESAVIESIQGSLPVGYRVHRSSTRH
jgi:hypothetical protein